MLFSFQLNLFSLFFVLLVVSFCINYTFCCNSSILSFSCTREKTGRYGFILRTSHIVLTHSAHCIAKCFLLSCLCFSTQFFPLSLYLWVSLCFAVLVVDCVLSRLYFYFFFLIVSFVLFNYKVEAQVQPVRQRARDSMRFFCVLILLVVLVCFAQPFLLESSFGLNENKNKKTRWKLCSSPRAPCTPARLN